MLKANTRVKLGSFLMGQRRPLFFALLGIVISSIVAVSLNREFQQRNQSNIETQLQAVLGTADQAISNWAIRQKSITGVWAHDPLILSEATRLLRLHEQGKNIDNDVDQGPLRQYFRQALDVGLIEGYFIVSPSNINLASSRDANLAVQNPYIDDTIFSNPAERNEMFVTAPTASLLPLPGPDGNDVPGRATMFVGTFLEVEGGIGLKFMVRLNPLSGFSGILEQGRLGTTGEVYAFDRSGRPVTDSRFEDQLRVIGLISSDQAPILNIEIRDPGRRLMASDPPGSIKDRPLTHMAAHAVRTGPGHDLAGYRDYRGIPVVGAWTWNDALDIGIAVEVDVAEAYRTSYMVQRILLTAVLVQSALILAFAAVYIRRRYEQILETEHLEKTVADRTAQLNIQRRRAEQSAKEAEHASKAKSSFLANMSHEIRTPLNGVIGMASLLADSDLPQKSRQRAEVIIRSANHLLEILNDILDISKVEAGRLELEEIPFNLSAEVLTIERLWRSELARKQVDFVLSETEGLIVNLVGDSTRLRQILNNLVSNATKFTSEGSVSLLLRQSPAGEGRVATEFEVRDTGLGMDEEVLAGLFDEFSQADVSTTRKFGGTGLGMAITRKLVDQMGGTIEVESKVGEGTNFRVTLVHSIDRSTIDESDADNVSGHKERPPAGR